MKIIILVGLPGSGKSSFAEKFRHYEIVNQDKLGSRQKCLEVFRKAMKEQKNVIIDRCNINRLQRLIWIKEAQRFGVKEINCIYFHVNPEECIDRISNRKGHATIKETSSFEKNSEIVYNFSKTFEIPMIEEGFQKILMINNEK